MLYPLLLCQNNQIAAPRSDPSESGKKHKTRIAPLNLGTMHSHASENLDKHMCQFYAWKAPLTAQGSVQVVFRASPTLGVASDIYF